LILKSGKKRMSEVVIKVENLSKQYRLGLIGTGTVSHDLNRWWHRVRGKPDPYLKLGEENNREVIGKSNYVWALKDIHFDVKKGETLGIIGKNGAGKSTLLKILSRVTGPTVGKFKVKGRIASLLEVGTGFHQELTGRENIFLNGAILGMTKLEIKNKLDEIVAFSGIERYIDTPAKRYSSGMYVRLAFAVAAHLESEILIADEVLAVGDAEFQKKCLGKMKDISREGRTVLFVSHNMAAVRSLCTKGLLINNGTLECMGDMETVITKYSNVFNTNSNDLLSITKREGIGEIKLSKFVICSGNSSDILKSGDPTYIDFYYVADLIDPKANYEFKITVWNSLGTPMFMLTNSYIEKNIYLKEKEGMVRFIIKSLPLNIGKYKVTLQIFKNGIVMDYLRETYLFEVSEGNYYNSSNFYKPFYQGFYIDFEVAETID
jgi:lipopolysaccharide transport system ATP-binding protein